MSKVTMPEPVAYFYQRDFDKYKDRYPGGIPVITIDQAEAYADARVREALEKAESIVRSNADACFSFVVKAMLHSNADAIRTLISKEQE